MRYRIAFALARSSPRQFRRWGRAGTIVAAPTIAICILSLILALKVGWIWLLGVLGGLAIIPLSVVIAALFIDTGIDNAHLDAIELTGDASTGVSMLKKGLKKRRGLEPLADLIFPTRRRIANRVEREAGKLGYRIEESTEQ